MWWHTEYQDSRRNSFLEWEEAHNKLSLACFYYDFWVKILKHFSLFRGRIVNQHEPIPLHKNGLVCIKTRGQVCHNGWLVQVTLRNLNPDKSNLVFCLWMFSLDGQYFLSPLVCSILLKVVVLFLCNWARFQWHKWHKWTNPYSVLFFCIT